MSLQTRLPLGPLGWSRIGQKLTGAIGAIILVTLLIAIAAWLSMVEISDRVDSIRDQQLPLINTANRFTELGGEISATAPKLISAQSNWEQETVWDDLEQQLNILAQLITAPDISQLLSNDTQRQLVQLLPSIRHNLQQLNENVSQSFDLSREVRQLSAALRWSHASFLDEIEPILEDSRFNTGSTVEQLSQSPDQVHSQTLRDDLQQREALMQLNADSNLAVGLILRASSQTNAHEIDATMLYLGEVDDRIRERLDILRNNPSAISLRQSVEQILSYAKEEQDISTLRKRMLEVQDYNRQLLEENKNLLRQLKNLISEQVLLAEQAAVAAADQADTAVNQGRALIIFMAVSGLMVALGVGWLYVGRSLLGRLNRLRVSMAAIAEGDLKAPVDTRGDDEISQMAEALLVFRNTAIEVEQANAESIIDNALIGLISTDAKGLIEFVNPNAQLLFDCEEQALIGRDIHSILSTEATPLNLFSQQSEQLSVIETLGTRNQQSFHLDLSMRTYYLRNQQKYLFTLADATERYQAQQILEHTIAERTKDLTAEIGERKRTEAELRATYQELIQSAKLASLGQLSAGIAHELNQPLSAIRYNAHNCSRLIEKDQSQQGQPLLAKIETLADKMAKIINHLKVFARKPSEEVIAVDMASVVDNALELYAPRITRMSCYVSITGLDDLPSASGDPIRLEQIMVNLIGNALDAMADVSKPALMLQGEFNTPSLRLTVTDNGCGLSEPAKQQLFDPFYTTKEAGEGLGLGLSISRKILLDLGGDISVESNEGDGTRFTITLKRYEESD